MLRKGIYLYLLLPALQLTGASPVQPGGAGSASPQALTNTIRNLNRLFYEAGASGSIDAAEIVSTASGPALEASLTIEGVALAVIIPLAILNQYLLSEDRKNNPQGYFQFLKQYELPRAGLPGSVIQAIGEANQALPQRIPPINIGIDPSIKQNLDAFDSFVRGMSNINVDLRDAVKAANTSPPAGDGFNMRQAGDLNQKFYDKLWKGLGRENYVFYGSPEIVQGKGISFALQSKSDVVIQKYLIPFGQAKALIGKPPASILEALENFKVTAAGLPNPPSIISNNATAPNKIIEPSREEIVKEVQEKIREEIQTGTTDFTMNEAQRYAEEADEETLKNFLRGKANINDLKNSAYNRLGGQGSGGGGRINGNAVVMSPSDLPDRLNNIGPLSGLQLHALGLSNQLSQQGFISANQKLPAGFIMVGSHGISINPDGTLSGLLRTEVVEVQTAGPDSDDPELEAAVQAIEAAINYWSQSRTLTEQDKDLILSTYLQKALSRDMNKKNILNNPFSEMDKDYLKKVKQIFDGKVIIKPGDILKAGAGVCRHFALLHKLIADRLGLKVTIQMGQFKNANGQLEPHEWNELQDGNQMYVIDDAQKVRQPLFGQQSDPNATQTLDRYVLPNRRSPVYYNNR